jgi:hypothetical protein
VNLDFERTPGCLLDVGSKLNRILGVEIAVRIGHRHIPNGLGQCHAGETASECGSKENASHQAHQSLHLG